MIPELREVLRECRSYVWNLHMDAQGRNVPSRVKATGDVLDRIDALLAQSKAALAQERKRVIEECRRTAIQTYSHGVDNMATAIRALARGGEGKT